MFPVACIYNSRQEISSTWLSLCGRTHSLLITQSKMFARRNSGLISIHKTFIASESALLWVILSQSGIRFSTLLPFWIYPAAIFVGVMLVPRSSKEAGLGRTDVPMSIFDSTQIAFRQVVFACASVFTIVVLCKDPGISRFFLLVFFGVLAPLLVILNRHQPRWIRWRFFFEKDPLPTLYIGGTSRFPNFQDWMAGRLRVGAASVGHITYREQELPIPGLRGLGGFCDLDRVMAENDVRQVVMLDLPDTTADAEKLLGCCLAHGSRLLIHNNFGYRLDYALQMVAEDGYSFLTLHDEPLEDPFNRSLKRALDIVVGACESNAPM